MIDYLLKPIMIFMIFVLIINAIIYVKDMLNVVKLVTLIIAFLIPAALIVFKLANLTLPDTEPWAFEWFCGMVSALSLIVNVALLRKKDIYNELYKEVPTALDRKIIGYLNGDGKLLSFTPYFFEELNLFDKEQKKWFQHVSKIYFNSAEVTYQELLELLEDNDGSESKITIVLKNEEGFDEEVTFNFVKINIDKNEDTIGYVLEVKAEQDKNLVDGFGYLLDSVDAPFAYYNDDSRNVIFRTNKAFKGLLGVRGYNVTYSELRHLVYPEDLSAFDRASSEYASEESYVYRMKTSLGLKKFKELKVVKDNHVISIIQMVSDNLDKLTDKKVVFDKIDNLIKANKPFGGMMISLNNFVDLFNMRGPIVAKELATRYTEFLQSEVLGNDDNICKISDIEYVLLFTDIDKFNSLVRDIQNKVSTISHYEFNYGNEVITTNNSVGIVYKNENILTSADFLNALDNSLALANEDKKEDGVSLYTLEKKKERTENKLTKENCSFDKVKISLDNSFLDDDEI